MDLQEFIKSLPKVDQHVHIVGSIQPETLLWLAEDSGKDIPYKTIDDVQHFFQYQNFPHFITVYSKLIDYITTEGQFNRITYELLQNEAQCNVQYVEASFSAPDHVQKSLDYDRMLDAINKGVKRAQLDFGIKCNLRVDLVRNYGPTMGMKVLDWIEEKRDNITSIDIGGSEERFPPKPFTNVYERAREMGLHRVAHAGEVEGPNSIWDAVKYLDVEHIGHGVSAVKDPQLMKYLLEHDVTLEMCPSSNIKTGVITTWERHPIRAFYETGLSVTVNSDDPSMFNTNMNDEYMHLHRRLNFKIPELFKLSLNAVDSSFLPEREKARMHESFVKEYEHLMDTHS